MPKKSYRKARSIKAALPVPKTVVDPISAPESVQSPGKHLVFFTRLAFFLVILWFLGKTFWDFIPHSKISTPAPAAGNTVTDKPVTQTNRMNITLKFDGIKSKWGYSGWATDGSANPNINKSIQGTDLQIRETKYKQGIGTHAPSEIVFDLEGKVKKFSCLVGPDKSGGTADIIIFKVSGDGNKLFESPVMRGSVEPMPVDLNVSGVKELNLQVLYGGAEQGWGHADWINVKFEKE
jgi:hypothetical protein